MKIIKFVLTLLLVLLIGGTLHYNLPQRDIVQVVGTDVKRIDIKKGAFGWGHQDAGTLQHNTRDVRFINTVRANGKPSVYRNEDTDWGWPPYFKFDTGNLTAEAQKMAKEDDTWVAVRHYGWRIPIWSIYPNAVSVKRVSGPDVFLIPWFNIFFLSLLAILVFLAWSWLRGWKEEHVDPVTDRIGEAADAAGEDIQEARSGLRKFFRRWLGSGAKKK